MTAIKVALFLSACALVCVTLRGRKPEMAMAVSLAAGVAAIIMSMGDIEEIIASASEVYARAEFGGRGVSAILKASGIAIACELGAAVCRDAGEGALASRIDIGARIAIAAIAAPIVLSVAGGAAELLI